MKRFISAFCATFILWIVLTWEEILQQGVPPLAVGIVTCIFAGIAAHHLFPVVSLHPVRVIYFLVYIPAFLWEVIKANADVAYRVLHPKMPINPGIVKISVPLESDYGKTILANSITLTPGTLTLDVKGQNFYVHWLNIEAYKPEQAAEMIIGRFMKFLKKVFQ